MPRMGSGGGITGLVALLGGGTFLLQSPQEQLSNLPVVKVNDDDSLISYWPSEDLGAAIDAPPVCDWWQMNETYDPGLCSHFTIGRLSSTPARALARAQICAALQGSECVLSPEVGLGVPAAFLNDHASGHMEMVLAPRFLPLGDERSSAVQHVRVTPPDGDGLIGTRTFVFNRTVNVEFFDGVSKAMHVREFEGAEAYCVQLLRASFTSECWERLDA
tara:strand:- start:1147 stop:1800 length:654 start_codon:yes stop_codon:yes gene_type:complete